MNSDEALREFGLPAGCQHRQTIQSLLEAELKLDLDQEADHDLIQCLCVQLMSIGEVEDSLLIWRAKSSNFDLACYLDIQFLCGAGLAETRKYLSSVGSPEARKALEHLDGRVVEGDFDDWSPTQWVEEYRYYYGLIPEPPDG